MNPKITIPKLLEKKKNGEPIAMLSAYDYPFARMADEAGMDIVLVGDSLAMAVLGHHNTLSVTMEDMMRHTQAVSRGVKNAFLVADMPYLSYQITAEEAVRNAGRFIKEGGAEAVKLEGGSAFAEIIRRLITAGIPVMGHIGLTPQFVHTIGGYKVQGKSPEAAEQLLQEAKVLESAGCFALVIECVPADLAGKMSKALNIPVIGIGAGAQCDGQVLVLHDLLGLNLDFHPKFVKQYTNIGEQSAKALRQYIEEVKARKFPSSDHSFP